MRIGAKCKVGYSRAYPFLLNIKRSHVKGQLSLTMAEWLRLDDNNKSVGIDAVATDSIGRKSILFLLCKVENNTWLSQDDNKILSLLKVLHCRRITVDLKWTVLKNFFYIRD